MMEMMAMRGDNVEMKTIRISSKRQVTIPQKYFDALNFGNEAECVLQGNALILRPASDRNGGEFAEQILADLLSQGYSGKALLTKFKEEQRRIRPAVEKLIAEADAVAASGRKGPSLDEIFGTED